MDKPLFLSVKASNWDEWLEKVESVLKEKGYHKYNQKWKGETFAYWKSFYPWAGEEPDYQVGILFYDWREYEWGGRIGLQFECMTLGDGRVDLSVTNDITLFEFERMAAEFYTCMGKWNSKK